jgi:hypothetical protein
MVLDINFIVHSIRSIAILYAFVNYIRIDIRVDMRSGIRTDIRSENILVGL